MVVQGREELERKYGFVPDFHDDHVESILIAADRIEVVIRTVDGPSRLQKRNEARFKLTFRGVKEFCLQGEMYGTVHSGKRGKNRDVLGKDNYMEYRKCRVTFGTFLFEDNTEGVKQKTYI